MKENKLKVLTELLFQSENQITIFIFNITYAGGKKNP